MALETKDQININYNTFFYATMCHVCKRFGDGVSLKRCSRCRLISYCGVQHQKQHWPQHKLLCKAVWDMQKDDGLEKLKIASDDWNYAKVALMKAVEKKKGSLELYERQMILFPRECAVCHEQNAESLIVCQNCAISFCKTHNIVHKDACAHLKLCLRINLSTLNKLPSFARMFLERSSNTETFYKFQDMHDFINGYGNIQKVRSSYDILTAILSEHLTRPLTLLHAMEVLNYVLKRKKELVIHIVAASDFEEHTLKMWEILLHLIPDTKVSLMIIMIGTELNYKSYSLTICDKCLSRKKKISFEFYEGLYEDYVRSSSFVKPNFAVGFDADIQVKGDRYVAEIKEPSIKMLAEQNCPFLLTNHMQDELEESINKVNTILNRKVDYVYSGKNPFASLRPCRYAIGRKLVSFNNNFVAIYRSLCS